MLTGNQKTFFKLYACDYIKYSWMNEDVLQEIYHLAGLANTELEAVRPLDFLKRCHQQVMPLLIQGWQEKLTYIGTYICNLYIN